ncbi:hypothetical protein KKHLCK_03985 [Candidatus Electrothrix laxa]
MWEEALTCFGPLSYHAGTEDAMMGSEPSNLGGRETPMYVLVLLGER